MVERVVFTEAMMQSLDALPSSYNVTIKERLAVDGDDNPIALLAGFNLYEAGNESSDIDRFVFLYKVEDYR